MMISTISKLRTRKIAILCSWSQKKRRPCIPKMNFIFLYTLHLTKSAMIKQKNEGSSIGLSIKISQHIVFSNDTRVGCRSTFKCWLRTRGPYYSAKTREGALGAITTWVSRKKWIKIVQATWESFVAMPSVHNIIYMTSENSLTLI